MTAGGRGARQRGRRRAETPVQSLQARRVHLNLVGREAARHYAFFFPVPAEINLTLVDFVGTSLGQG